MSNIEIISIDKGYVNFYSYIPAPEGWEPIKGYDLGEKIGNQIRTFHPGCPINIFLYHHPEKREEVKNWKHNKGITYGEWLRIYGKN